MWNEFEAWVQGNDSQTGPALQSAINEIRRHAKEKTENWLN